MTALPLWICFHPSWGNVETSGGNSLHAMVITGVLATSNVRMVAHNHEQVFNISLTFFNYVGSSIPCLTFTTQFLFIFLPHRTRTGRDPQQFSMVFHVERRPFRIFAKFIRHDILRRVVKACIDALEQISGGSGKGCDTRVTKPGCGYPSPLQLLL